MDALHGNRLIVSSDDGYLARYADEEMEVIAVLDQPATTLCFINSSSSMYVGRSFLLCRFASLTVYGLVSDKLVWSNHVQEGITDIQVYVNQFGVYSRLTPFKSEVERFIISRGDGIVQIRSVKNELLFQFNKRHDLLFIRSSADSLVAITRDASSTLILLIY